MDLLTIKVAAVAMLLQTVTPVTYTVINVSDPMDTAECLQVALANNYSVPFDVGSIHIMCMPISQQEVEEFERTPLNPEPTTRVPDTEV